MPKEKNVDGGGVPKCFTSAFLNDLVGTITTVLHGTVVISIDSSYQSMPVV